MDTPRIFVPPPLIVAGTLVAGLWIDGRAYIWPMQPTLLLIVGAVLIVGGLILIGLALRLFRRLGTRPEPWQPSSELARSGVYRFTRNPMYLGMVIIYLGIALGLQSSTAGLLLLPLVAVLDRLVIAREEAYLSRRFGASFEAYRRRVRRWM
jgi:protein-S-isoprenylcysteine O-methyltransferase Ste14